MQRQGKWSIDNGLLAAEIDGNGNVVVTATVSGQKEMVCLGHHFYDVGDGGDSYNFDPLANDAPIKAVLTDIEGGREGPLVSSFKLTYNIEIPEGLEPNSPRPEQIEKRRTTKTITHTIKTEVSLRKGVPILFFSTVFENQSRDHRLEVRFDSGRKVSESISECHFSVARRPAIEEHPQLPVAVGHEVWPESYFCQRFFIASDQVFFNTGLPEYRTENSNVAITLVRATSYLSRGRLRARGGGAGPWLEVPEANCLGVNHCDYGWAFIGAPGNGRETKDEQISRAYNLADLYEGRLVALPAGKFEAARQQSLIELTNPLLYITSVSMDGGKLYIRILNTAPDAQSSALKVSLPVASPGKVNFLGQEFKALPAKSESGATTVELGFSANELLTIAFTLS